MQFNYNIIKQKKKTNLLNSNELINVKNLIN